MFTGIISGLGRICSVVPLGGGSEHGKRLTLACPPHYLDDVALGDSIAINGACMTVAALDAPAQRFCVDVSAASLGVTTGLETLGGVNLEKALRASERLGGHLVAGHVDGVGLVSHFAPHGESWQLLIQAPVALAKYLAVKGSITVDGVSLTVNQVQDLVDACQISINLIGHTLQHTTLANLQAGARVNLEVDLIARYVERMLSGAGAPL